MTLMSFMLSNIQILLFFTKNYTLIEKIFIRGTDTIITVNDSIGEILSERYKIPTPITMMNYPV